MVAGNRLSRAILRGLLPVTSRIENASRLLLIASGVYLIGVLNFLAPIVSASPSVSENLLVMAAFCKQAVMASFSSYYASLLASAFKSSSRAIAEWSRVILYYMSIIFAMLALYFLLSSFNGLLNELFDMTKLEEMPWYVGAL